MKKQLFSISLLLFVALSLSAQADWAGHQVYRSANDTVKRAPEVAFMGNSITQMWLEAHPNWFASHNFAPRGIGGQTSAHMLCRFQADVIDLHPAKVMILSGVNDIAGNNGPIDYRYIVENILSMCQLAQANGITPYVCSPLPAHHFFWAPDRHPADSVYHLYCLVRDMANEHGYPFVDYYPHFEDPAQPHHLRPELTMDGVHLTPDAYLLLEKLALEALAKPLPVARVRLTFDDGLLDQYKVAWPLLKKYGMHGTFYVIANHTDKGILEWGAKPMSWKQLYRMVADGQKIGNHSFSHLHMAELPLAEVEHEVLRNDSAIYAHLAVHPNTFIFPFGSRTPEADKVALNAMRTKNPNAQFGDPRIAVGGNEYPTTADIHRLVAEIVRNRRPVTMMIHGITEGWDAWKDATPFVTLIQAIAEEEKLGNLIVE